MYLSNRALLIMAVGISILLILSGILLIMIIFPHSLPLTELELTPTIDGPNGTTEVLMTQTNIAIENYNATQTAVALTPTAVPVTLAP